LKFHNKKLVVASVNLTVSKIQDPKFSFVK
jgi:hypothetical protein